MKFIKAVVIIIVILGLIAGGGFLLLKNYYETQVNYHAASNEKVKVEIPSGSSTDAIGTLLKDAGLINDLNVFKFYLRENNLGGKLKAGKYEFLASESMKELVEDMVEGVFAKGVTITFSEGLRFDEVVGKITAAYAKLPATEQLKDPQAFEKGLNDLIAKPDDADFGSDVNAFLKKNKPAGKSLEGFLYPDTYEFAKAATPKDIIQKFLDNFVLKTTDLTITNGLSFYDNLILASIVERESSPKEAANVAGVFLKRLQIGMRLGSDVTLLYELKRWQPEPTAQELRAVHAYNTRQIAGLPPTPIGNPGIVTIKATATAAPGIYLYFLADSRGILHYAKDYAGHNANIQTYLK